MMQSKRKKLTTQEACDLIARFDEKFKPVFAGRPIEELVALASYFLPRRSQEGIAHVARAALHGLFQQCYVRPSCRGGRQTEGDRSTDR